MYALSLSLKCAFNWSMMNSSSLSPCACVCDIYHYTIQYRCVLSDMLHTCRDFGRQIFFINLPNYFYYIKCEFVQFFYVLHKKDLTILKLNLSLRLYNFPSQLIPIYRCRQKTREIQVEYDRKSLNA